MTTIEIAAVGDLMAKPSLIRNTKQPGGGHSFTNLFAHVAPRLQKADLTIGNLETNFADTKRKYRSRTARGPRFTCPDELAPALKEAGFDVLVTANNHCMDYGSQGLMRTLRILDKNGLRHTGTYNSAQQAEKYLIYKVKGISIGILSYTTGTNSNPVPANKQWLVNRINSTKVIRDIKAIRKKVDVVLLYLHFGREYHYYPNHRQKKLVNLFFKHGANLILGSHPHVLQPKVMRSNKQFVIYSMGNFVCSKLKKNPFTQSSIILNMKIVKNAKGATRIKSVNCISTCVNRSATSGKTEIVPIQEALSGSVTDLTTKQRERMKKQWRHTKSILKHHVN